MAPIAILPSCIVEAARLSCALTVAAFEARCDPAVDALGLGEIACPACARCFGARHEYPEIMGRRFDLGGLAGVRLRGLDDAIAPGPCLGGKSGDIPIVVQGLD